MNKTTLTEKLEAGIRYSIYLLIVLLPFSNSAIEIFFTIALALWIIKHSLLRSFRPEPSVLNKPLYIFVLVAVFSVIGSSSFDASLRAFFSKFLQGILLYFFMTEVIKQKKHVYLLIGLFLATAIVVSIDGVIQYFFTGVDLFRQREIVREGVTAGFDHSNKFAAYLLFPLFIVSGILIGKIKKINPKQIALSCALALLLSVFMLTKSRAALLGLIFAIPFFVFFINRKIFFITAAAAAVCTLILVFLILSDSTTRMFRLEQITVRDTAMIRLHAWKDTVNMIKDRPVLGHGINTYMRLFQKYRRDPEQYPTYAHNCYLQLAAETGLAGLIAFLWILITFFRRCAATYNRSEHTLLGITAGVFAFLVHSFFDTNLYSLQLNILFWFMLGLAVAESKIER